MFVVGMPTGVKLDFEENWTLKLSETLKGESPSEEVQLDCVRAFEEMG